jgi:hypothetical protein
MGLCCSKEGSDIHIADSHPRDVELLKQYSYAKKKTLITDINNTKEGESKAAALDDSFGSYNVEELDK